MVIHGTELVAVQAQVAPVVTCTLRKAVAEVSDTLVVESTAAHAGAACVTVNTRPPMVRFPVRDEFVVFAAAE